MGTMPVRSSSSKAAVNPAGPAPMMMAVCGAADESVSIFGISVQFSVFIF
jgi:hypothetical protein